MFREFDTDRLIALRQAPTKAEVLQLKEQAFSPVEFFLVLAAAAVVTVVALAIEPKHEFGLGAFDEHVWQAAIQNGLGDARRDLPVINLHVHPSSVGVNRPAEARLQPLKKRQATVSDNHSRDNLSGSITIEHHTALSVYDSGRVSPLSLCKFHGYVV